MLRALGCLTWVFGLAALLPLPAGAAANGRALELVTPPQPTSGIVYDFRGIDESGGRLVFRSAGPIPGAVAGDLISFVLAERGASGWSDLSLGNAYKVFAINNLLPREAVAFSADLRTSIWTSNVPLVPGGPPEENVGFYRRGPDGAFVLLADTGNSFNRVAGSSESGDRVVFTNEAHLLPADAGRSSGESVYELAGADLRMVDVDSGGSLFSACGSLVDENSGVSRTTERIFFTANMPPGAGCPPARVYMRVSGSTTVDISASHCTRVDCNATQDVNFAGATPSGSSAFLLTAQQLTDDDLDELSDLYRYDVVGDALTLVSTSPPGLTGEVTEPNLRTSEDGSSVYFFASGRLLPGLGDASGTNLYLADDSGLHFIAATTASDQIEIAKDGLSAVFVTAAPLDAGDTDAQLDVYRYEAGSGQLVEVSVGPTGGNGPTDAMLTAPSKEEAPSSSLTDDGGAVFFETTEPLVAADDNSLKDVYEWSGGQLAMISGGVPGYAATFMAATGDGSSAVFVTAASLLDFDVDGGERDIYVDRVGGGFPNPPLEPECGGGACEPATRPRLDRPVSATASLAPRKALRLLRVSRSEDSGEVSVVSISAPASGPVSVVGRARLGKALRQIASAHAIADSAGMARLRLSYSAAARRHLAGGGSLRARFVVTQGSHHLSFQATLSGGNR